MLIDYMNPDFRYENENGLLLQLVHEGWKQINVIYSKKGGIRGGHYHKYNVEGFYVISGAFKLCVWRGKEKEDYEMKAGDMFYIQKNVYHTFEYTEETWLVSFYDKGVELDDNNKDIWSI